MTVLPGWLASYAALDDEALRGAGFSRSKTVYCRDLAARLADGSLDLDGLWREIDALAGPGETRDDGGERSE